MNKKKNINFFKNVDLPLTLGGVAVVFALGISMLNDPASATKIANEMFKWLTRTFSPIYLWFVFIALGFSIFIYFSKYGNIRLGNEKPVFRSFTLFAMVTGMSFGAGVLYWGFLESLYYYSVPVSYITPTSAESARWALMMVYQHNGFLPWSIFVLCSMPMAYAFNNKGQKELNLSALLANQYGEKIFNRPVRKILDFFIIFACIGYLAQTMGFSLPLVTAILGKIFNVSGDPFVVTTIIMLTMAVVYSLSSYIGIEKGLAKIADFNIYATMAFLGIVVIASDKWFLVNSATHSIGAWLSNIIELSLQTDVINGTNFPQEWTTFFWAFWIVVSPSMALLVAKIFKGQRLKDLVSLIILGGSTGSLIFMSICQHYSMTLELGGADLLGTLQSQGGHNVIVRILESLPFPMITSTIYFVCIIFFIATSIDGSSFALASMTTKQLDENGNPNPLFRLFWCVLITLTPLLLTYLSVPINTIKTIGTLVTLPLILIFSAQVVGLIRWFKTDWKGKTAQDIIELDNVLKELEAKKAEENQAGAK